MGLLIREGYGRISECFCCILKGGKRERRDRVDKGIVGKFGNWKFWEGFRRSIPAAISVRKNVMIEHRPNRQPPRASVRNCRRSLKKHYFKLLFTKLCKP